MKTTLIMATNGQPDSLECLRACLASLRKSNPRQAVYIEFLSCEVPAWVSKINPKVTAKSVDVPNANEPGVVVCHRAKMVQESLKSDIDAIGYIDCDILVRKPLTEIWQTITQRTLAVRFRPDKLKDEKLAFQAGVFFLGNSPYIKSMVDDWEIACRTGEWWIDQLSLFQTYTTHHKHIILRTLGIPEHDYSFHSYSMIWHRRGVGKANRAGLPSLRWYGEFDEYAKLATEYENAKPKAATGEKKTRRKTRGTNTTQRTRRTRKSSQGGK